MSDEATVEAYGQGLPPFVKVPGVGEQITFPAPTGIPAKDVLSAQLRQAADHGMRIESATSDIAVLTQGSPVSHAQHACIALLIAVAWGVIFVLDALDAVLYEGSTLAHTTQILIVAVSVALWAAVWAGIASNGGQTSHQLSVTESGELLWRNLG